MKKLKLPTERQAMITAVVVIALFGLHHFHVISRLQRIASFAALYAAARPAASHGSGVPDLGINADLQGKPVFPPDNPWNQKVDTAPVDPNSATILATIGGNLHADFGSNWNGGPFGIPYVVVSGSTPRVPLTFQYASESDPGPYPIPSDAPIEGGVDGQGDRHVLVIDRDNWKLYETWDSHQTGNKWACGSGAIFDLSTGALRPAGWTSADAAGLPVFPGLARYDEVALRGVINHALRFTVVRSRRAYIAPARHFASTWVNPILPPMGMRVRLKADYNISYFPPQARVVLQALKTYGMILADNGSNLYISGAPDKRWNDDDLGMLRRLKSNDFEVVQMGPVTD